MNGKKIKTIDRLYITTTDGDQLNVAGGNIQLVYDGKTLELVKLDIQVTPVIKSRTKGPHKATTAKK